MNSKGVPRFLEESKGVPFANAPIPIALSSHSLKSSSNRSKLARGIERSMYRRLWEYE